MHLGDIQLSVVLFFSYLLILFFYQPFLLYFMTDCFSYNSHEVYFIVYNLTKYTSTARTLLLLN